jgi:hypothetical protein
MMILHSPCNTTRKFAEQSIIQEHDDGEEDEELYNEDYQVGTDARRLQIQSTVIKLGAVRFTS